MLNPRKKLLLELIHTESDVGPLVEEGLLYSQIAQMLAELADERLVRMEKGKPLLTDAGLAELRRDDRTGKRRSDGGFIVPLFDAKVDKLAIDAVYLPPKRFSFF